MKWATLEGTGDCNVQSSLFQVLLEVWITFWLCTMVFQVFYMQVLRVQSLMKTCSCPITSSPKWVIYQNDIKNILISVICSTWLFLEMLRLCILLENSSKLTNVKLFLTSGHFVSEQKRLQVPQQKHSWENLMRHQLSDFNKICKNCMHRFDISYLLNSVFSKNSLLHNFWTKYKVHRNKPLQDLTAAICTSTVIFRADAETEVNSSIS